MQSLPRVLVDSFAEAFAGISVGFSAIQITKYFQQYSNLVKPSDHYAMRPTRRQLFIESVYSLSPKLQYYSLNDLTWSEHESRYQYPSEEKRTLLRNNLHNFISNDPIGLGFSAIRETAFREDWITCYSRLQNNPASCITASRTMLETILRTIVNERGEEPDTSGDLGRLLRQVQDVIGFNRQDRQPEHQVLQGLASVIIGICSISNAAIVWSDRDPAYHYFTHISSSRSRRASTLITPWPYS
jgi:hypothetical protein